MYPRRRSSLTKNDLAWFRSESDRSRFWATSAPLTRRSGHAGNSPSAVRRKQAKELILAELRAGRRTLSLLPQELDRCGMIAGRHTSLF